jgi:hypothetical protein
MSEIVANSAVIEPPSVLKELSANSVKFCEYYALNNNALQSCILAGFASSSARTYAYDTLLKNPKVLEAVEYFRAVNASNSTYTPAKIVAQWSEMASFNILDCCDENYILKPLSQLDEEQKRRLGIALTGLKITVKNGRQYVEPKMARETALQELGKIHRLYADDKQQGQGLNLTINVGQQVVVEQELSENIGHLVMKDEELA